MSIVRFDPFGELSQLQDRINRAFDWYGHAPGQRRHDEGLMTTGAWAPPVDIYQNADQELVLKAELPDIAPEDIELNINNDTLTISGEKRLSNEVKEEQYHRIERQYGAFSRSFSLPSSIDATKISAEHKNGVLTVVCRRVKKPSHVKLRSTCAAEPSTGRR